MVEIDNIIISRLVFTDKFVCDLNACKGICCVQGDSGAPLEEEETKILAEIIDEVKPYLRPEGVAAIEEQGVFVIDTDKEKVTPLINGKECAYTTFDKNGIVKCGIEQAHQDGKIDFKKPISCHLYPIRTSKLSIGEAMNCDEWEICSPARECGAKLDVKVFRFLKEPLIRKYGEEFYDKMIEADKYLSKEG